MAQNAKNTNKFQINLGTFAGGMSVDYKNGVANSFYNSVALDFRKKSSEMSVLPGMTTIITNLLDLPVAMLQDPTGTRWMIGDQDTDVQCGLQAGCRTILLEYAPSANKRDVIPGLQPTVRFTWLEQGVQYIVNQT